MSNLNTNIIGVISNIFEINAEVDNLITIEAEIKATGPRGEKGDAPVKGVDYFTEDDINSIIDLITEDKTFTHIQIAPLTVWTINHNLNKYPSVTVVDAGKNVIIGEINYIDENNVILTFKSEFSGRAYFN